MSRFDPFNLYTHKQYHSHSGQIIRKKPVKSQYAISNDMIRDAKRVLEAVGLYSSIPSVSQIKTISDSFTFYGSNDNPYLINVANSNPIPVPWSGLWPGIKTRFSSLLETTPTSFAFEIKVISFMLFGVIEIGNDSSNPPNPYFYFSNPASALQIVQQTGTSSITGRNCGFGIQALTSERCLTFYDFNSTNVNLDYGGFFVRPKSEATDTTGLYSITSTEQSVFFALKDNDFTAFNPALIYFYFTQSRYPIQVSDYQITFQVSMTVNS